MGYEVFYIVAHIACIILLGIILFKIVRGVNKQLSRIYTGNLIVSLILYFSAEIFWSLVDSGHIGTTPSLLYISNIITYSLISYSAYLWFVLSEAFQQDSRIENPTTRHLIGVPVLLSVIMCVTAYRNGLVFYVDENGNFINGRLYLILIIIPFAYMIMASVKAFGRYLDKERYAERNIYLMIAIFPFAPIILGVLQAVYWRVPLLCYAAVIAVYYVYITSLENQVSIDPLTQINNRNQLYRYLVQKMHTQEPGMSLFLMFVDIDGLRAINESQSHVEGDRVLVRVAGAIKDACQGSRSRMFVSRYGGDEFVVVAEMAYKAEVTYLAEQIRNNVKKISGMLPYNLSVSIGIAQYDYDTPISIQTFIARAGMDLSKQKG